MKFMCLVYHDEGEITALSPEDDRQLTRDSLAYDDVLARNGHLVLAHALESPKAAKRVRRRKGKKLITDGPFAETKEQLLGFIFIEAKDREEALELASHIPLAKTGTIEVRAVQYLSAD